MPETPNADFNRDNLERPWKGYEAAATLRKYDETVAWVKKLAVGTLKVLLGIAFCVAAVLLCRACIIATDERNQREEAAQKARTVQWFKDCEKVHPRFDCDYMWKVCKRTAPQGSEKGCSE